MMDIRAQSGDLVRYINFNAGKLSDLMECDRFLYRGGVYTVDHTEVRRFGSSVYLKDVPGVPFNTVMFEDVVDASSVNVEWNLLPDMMSPGARLE